MTAISQDFLALLKTLRFQQIANLLLSEGKVPVSPNRPCALRWCCTTVSGIIAPEGMPQLAGGLRAVAKKER